MSSTSTSVRRSRARVRLVSFAAALGLCLALAPAARAQSTASSDVFAEIVTPLTIDKYKDLDFGQISVGSGGGFLEISSAGAVTTRGDVVVQGGDASPAQFEVSGEAGLSYDVTLPNRIQVTDGTGNTMGVGNFDPSNAGTGTLSASGIDDFTVGATLKVHANQAPGVYAGSFDVTVAYQ